MLKIYAWPAGPSPPPLLGPSQFFFFFYKKNVHARVQHPHMGVCSKARVLPPPGNFCGNVVLAGRLRKYIYTYAAFPNNNASHPQACASAFAYTSCDPACGCQLLSLSFPNKVGKLVLGQGEVVGVGCLHVRV